MKYLVILYSILLLLSCQSKSEQEAQIPLPENLVETEGYARIYGTDIYYKTIGKGDPLYIIHGGPGMDHTYFLPQMKELARDHQLVFYDQRASGKSLPGLDSTKFSFNGFVKDLNMLRETLEHDKISILGHSWGGLLAMHYATQHPLRLESLILANSMAPNADIHDKQMLHFNSKQTKEDSTELAQLMLTADWIAGKASAYEDWFRIMLRSSFFDTARIDELTLTLADNYKSNSGYLELIYPELASYDLLPALSTLDVPTLVIYGDQEYLGTIAGPAIVDAMPNAKLEILKNCGHFPFIEQPSEFYSKVREIIKNKSQGPEI